ncbi:MAG TPA: FAD binding domain-containing protein [Candidatus Limnocylindrales bacterium]|jgi:CO/xanthine dehydrogenase FAD-binding subunit
MTSRFVAPTSLDEAIAILAADAAARPVAGGTDLVVASRQGRRPLPDAIVAIDRIEELEGAGVDASGELRLGALTPHAWLAGSPEVVAHWTALADAAAIVGSPATRATGTIGGNLMNASPAAETTAPFVVFDAVATLRGPDGGRRDVPVGELAVGPGRTLARGAELLSEVRVPRSEAAIGSAYIRLEYRRAMEIAVVGAAALVTLDGSGPGAGVRAARIALTAVAPTVVRAPEAEAAFVGTAGDRAACRAAGAAAAAAASPIDDVRASAEYRRAMIEVVVARTLAAAVARARGETVAVPASRWAHGQTV